MLSVSGLFQSKPRSLGEGLRRIVKYASKNSGETKPQLVAQSIGYRKYSNGVFVEGRDNGFWAGLKNRQTADDFKNDIFESEQIKRCNIIGRVRFPETNIIRNFYGRMLKFISINRCCYLPKNVCDEGFTFKLGNKEKIRLSDFSRI